MFDILLESGRRSSLVTSWGRGVALTLHIAVLGALWRTAASPPSVSARPIVTLFPPGPVTASRETREPPLPQPVGDPGPIVFPPVEIPSIPEGALRSTSGDPFVGAPDTAPAGSPFSGSAERVYPISLVQEAPELLTAPPPAYPVLLREAGVQGQVIVAAVVDTLGQAEAGSVRIVLSDNRGFDAAALATVRAARFRPARLYGRAVRVLVQVPVVFRLF